jgi:hypothetical protein
VRRRAALCPHCHGRGDCSGSGPQDSKGAANDQLYKNLGGTKNKQEGNRTMANHSRLMCVIALFCVLAERSGPAQTAFPITFDATALDAARFNVDFNGVGGTAFSNAVTVLDVQPGLHTFCAPASADCFQFSVLNDGTLSFAPELAAYVSGQGSSTLVVTGFDVNFNATALSSSTFNINYNEVGGTHFVNAPSTFTLLPGLYTFCAPASADCFQFSVLNDGMLAFDAALDPIVGGRGTNALSVSGFPITIDATARGAIRFNISFNGVGGTDFPATVAAGFTVLPGSYSFCAPSSNNCFEFAVTIAGTLDYSPALDACVLGRGTDRLTVICDPNLPNHPPVCSFAQATPHLLWPPNHQMTAVAVSGVVDPDGDSVSLAIINVMQDEPVRGLGDGDTAPDALLQGLTLLLRAERSAGANGRVYHIRFSADDGHGARCEGEVTAAVPKSVGQGTTVIDEGALYDSTKP